jgi:beta-lactamase class A
MLRLLVYKKYLFCGFAGLILGLILGYFFTARYFGRVGTDTYSFAIREQANNYKLISPLLAFDDNKEFYEFLPLKQKVGEVIERLKKENKVSDVGFYFREGSHWVGLNENKKFTPASLMKVPLMIAYFKQAETDPGILQKKYLYDGKNDFNVIEKRKSVNVIKAGQWYTVDELIKHMVENSDNNATAILQDNIDYQAFKEVYSDLGMELPSDDTTKDIDYLSPKQYSLFLRILRNATYLNKEYSEKAMEYLTQTDFQQGIVSSLPKDIIVAHKFGEDFYKDSDGHAFYEFHDCGIILYPNTPYLLCLMTKADKPENLEEAVEKISKVVFDQVLNNYK